MATRKKSQKKPGKKTTGKKKENTGNQHLMSRGWLWSIGLICLFPTLCSFALQGNGAMAGTSWPVAEQASVFAEPFLYLVTQVSGFVLAIIAGILCFTHFARTGEVTTSILGVGLFCAGLLDIWQTLGATYFLPVKTSMNVFIPLCWTTTRGLYAVVIIAAVSVYILSSQVKGEHNRRKQLNTIAGYSATFLLLCGATIFLFGSRPEWSANLYQEGLSRHALKLGPLFLFILAGAYVLPTYYKWHPSVFGQTLVLSCIALALAQVHFIFGSSGLLDWHFRAANLLKVLGYLVPLIGLVFDYQNTYQRIEKTNRALQDKLFMFEQSQGVSRQKQNVLATLMENLPDPIYLLDTSLRITQVNDAMARLAGLSTPLLAMGKTPDNLVGDAAGQVAQANGKKVLKNGEPIFGNSEQISFPNGHQMNLIWTFNPVRDEEGRPVAVVCIGREPGLKAA